MDPSLLRRLKMTRKHTTSSTAEPTLRLALINARSITNKTFILNDFFTSRNLDFMFLTETWLRAGEFTAFAELLPPDCTFINTPRITGKGGGLASVFKSSFRCRQTPSNSFSSFELQLFEIHVQPPVLCAVIYRPPKFNKDFIQDFYDFVAGIVLNTEHLLIIGDFNIHVCCDSRPLVKDFLNLIDSFNLKQSVTAPTHEKGHTLDLVLSLGLNVCISEICDVPISDHLPVMFTLTLPGAQASTRAPARRLRALNPLTASQFSVAFIDSMPPTSDLENISAEEILSSFNSTCSNILDLIAPFKDRRPKPVTEPWLNDYTRTLRRTCRRAERKWKRDKLYVSLGILRESLAKYQKAVKSAKTQFISNLVSKNSHRPQVIFATLKNLINPCKSPAVVPSLPVTAST